MIHFHHGLATAPLPTTRGYQVQPCPLALKSWMGPRMLKKLENPDPYRMGGIPEVSRAQPTPPANTPIELSCD